MHVNCSHFMVVKGTSWVPSFMLLIRSHFAPSRVNGMASCGLVSRKRYVNLIIAIHSVREHLCHIVSTLLWRNLKDVSVGRHLILVFQLFHRLAALGLTTAILGLGREVCWRVSVQIRDFVTVWFFVLLITEKDFWASLGLYLDCLC
jgi:hypothetical protein